MTAPSTHSLDPAIVQRFTAWVVTSRKQWLSAVPHASAVAAEAWCRALPQHNPKRGPFNPFVWKKMESAVRDAFKATRTVKRGPPPVRLPDAVAGPARASQTLPLDEVEALLQARGTTRPQAEALAAWLAGESLDASAKRLGLHRSGVAYRRRRARQALGLSVVEVQALVGRMRGVSLEDAAWGAWKPARGGVIGTRGSRAWRARRGSRPVDPSTVSLRIKSALEKIRGPYTTAS